MFNTSPPLSLNQSSSFAYELQKLLVNKGHDIRTDGVYHYNTINALVDFEKENGFFPDGRLDALTLDALLK